MELAHLSQPHFDLLVNLSRFAGELPICRWCWVGLSALRLVLAESIRNFSGPISLLLVTERSQSLICGGRYGTKTLFVWEAQPEATIDKTPHRTVTWISTFCRCPLGTCLKIHTIRPLGAASGWAARPRLFFREAALTIALSVQPLCRAGTKCGIFRPPRITQEIRSCALAGFEHIIFYDDCIFAVSEQLDSEVLRFAEAIAAAHWAGTFQLELRCDAVVALSERALADLIAVGCRQINMGIEKANVQQLRRLGKSLGPQTAQDASHRLATAGIRTAGCFILGGPGETTSDLEETIGFAQSLPLTFAQFNPLALYPGTRLFEEFGVGEPGDWLKHCLDIELAQWGTFFGVVRASCWTEYLEPSRKVTGRSTPRIGYESWRIIFRRRNSAPSPIRIAVSQRNDRFHGRVDLATFENEYTGISFMLTLHDRLYGPLELPDIVRQLAMTCPVILRLREIRQPNIPFLSHPSFANVDRYEHSLGVAHLAWRWSRRNRLPRDLGTAITIAALYHDGATPAFGHLFEEFLSRFGFDHEKTLANVVIGNSGIPGQADAQVFLGYPCRLRHELDSVGDPASPLTPLRIMELVQGEGVFGRLLKGPLDLDNIDNVIRACTFMGILTKGQQLHPYEVADALVVEDDSIKVDGNRAYAVQAWAKLREILYSAILDNPLEFRSQTTLKWAIEECVVKTGR